MFLRKSFVCYGSVKRNFQICYVKIFPSWNNSYWGIFVSTTLSWWKLLQFTCTWFNIKKAGICTNQVEISGESQSAHIFYLLSGPHAHVLKTNIFGYHPRQPMPKHISCSVLTYAARELCVRFSTSCLHFRCCRWKITWTNQNYAH